MHPDFGSNPAYGIPYVVVPATQPLVPITYNAYGDAERPGTVPDPAERARSKAAATVTCSTVQQGTCQLYELFAASAQRRRLGRRVRRRVRPAIERLAARRLDVSADAAGLPILPGLVRYDEVAAGRIRHALRVTFAPDAGRLHHPGSPLRLVEHRRRTCRRWGCVCG